MVKKTFFFFAALTVFLAAACDNKTQNATNRPGAKNSIRPDAQPKPEVKTGVAPVADDEIAVILMENPEFGVIKMELYSNIAPEMVKRFKELARAGFYNGVAFHRVSPKVVQGGDPLSKDDDPTNDGMGKSDKPNVPAEFSDIPYERGIVGAARSTDYNSANAQFFIAMQRTPEWDTNYTVFGKVIEGLEYADKITAVQKQGERPVTPVRIKNLTIQPK